MPTEKIYWKNIKQLDQESPKLHSLQQREFPEKLPADFYEPSTQQSSEEDSNTSRRDFLKYVGFGTAAATLAACDGPVIKSVPYVVKPEQIVPGNANFYATTYYDGYDFSNILIKTREGRPIKIESNSDAPKFYQTNARVHASILSLYDTRRFQLPQENKQDTTWEDFYGKVKERLRAISQAEKRVALITNTILSPTTKAIIEQLIETFPSIEHHQYDAISSDAVLDAFEARYGIRAIPDYDFSQAENIVSFDADFLGDWQAGGYDSGYAKSRIPKGQDKSYRMSHHLQLESNMTLTGANADHRIVLTPAKIKQVLAHVYRVVCENSSLTSISDEQLRQLVDRITSQFNENPSGSVVVTGIDHIDAQKMVLSINEKLQSRCFNPQTPLFLRAGKTDTIDKVLEGILSGEISGVLFHGVNPVYSHPKGDELAEAIKSLELSVAFATAPDETTNVSEFVAATSHCLEAWSDFNPTTGYYCVAQPVIRTLFHTKDYQQILLDLIDADIEHLDYLRRFWEGYILESSSWNQVVHDGYYTKEENFQVTENSSYEIDVKALTEAQDYPLSLILYTKTSLGDGSQANNPWLQEMPDPITRASWDNYLTISTTDAKRFELENKTNSFGALDGSYAKIRVGYTELEVPVLIQPGQANGTVGLALGYGRKEGVQEEMQVGVNAYKLLLDNRLIQSVEITPLDKKMHEFACIQLQNTVMGRGEIIKETTLEHFNTKEKDYYNPVVHVSKNHIETPVSSQEVDIWTSFDHSVGHFFNLSVDLNACTGCGACVIACQAENNVPVVGKREVRRSRDMHWLRIDRYYSSEVTFDKDQRRAEDTSWFSKAYGTFRELEVAAENPQVVFQPVMCQHCNHAPCETVCPVAATSHGRQGQNQMAYNRCIGTRYCANNCPYKVRRFNWFRYNKNSEFDYNMNNSLGRMVLNPDVVVRSRGVMEKCSFCIQRTQKTIMDAKLEGRTIQDGEFHTACSKACTSGALVFGDANDKDSEVAKLKEQKRKYYLLESVGTKPNVMYQVKVRNTTVS